MNSTNGRVIILTFHGVGPVSRDAEAGERHCWLETRSFEAILDVICNAPHVRLTIDDGNVSDFDIVLPALLQRKLRASFFVCSGRLDQSTFLGRGQVRELLANGMEVGSHGIGHLSWRKLSQERLCDELEGSRHALEKVCKVPVDSAGCPFGAYDRTVLNGLRRAGYRSVYTCDGGDTAENQWLKPRTTVTRSMSLSHIQRLVQQRRSMWKQWLMAIRKVYKRLR